MSSFCLALCHMSDVVVVGGGVIGLSVAYELAGQGVSVTVLEQGQFGQEASWAGAGMLPPGNFSAAPQGEPKLRGLSYSLWNGLSAQLQEQTGVDNGFRRCGCLHVSFDANPAELQQLLATWHQEGVAAEALDPGELQRYEPAVSQQVTAAFRLPDLCQVRNPRHLKALQRGCELRGVKLICGTQVVDWHTQGEQVLAAQTADQHYSASKFVITAGAWTRHLLQRAGIAAPIGPVRGQIALLNATPLPFRHVIEVGHRYLVPRADGRILIGSTMESVGFDKRTTTSGINGLLQFAQQVVPSLANATVERCWAGLRPGSSDGLPIIDRVPEHSNLFVAAGHFRAGLQLSPATAVIIRQLLLGQAVDLELNQFSFAAKAGQTMPSHW